MFLWLKIISKEFSQFFRNSDYRTFSFLATFYGGKKRNTPTYITLKNKKFHTPDSLSFVWQYYEIFFKKYYKFIPSNFTSPRIIDLGSNVGLSLTFFAKEYPNANITAYEADPTIFNFLKENSTHFPKVELINKAVWINSEGIKIHSNGADSASIIWGQGNIVEVPSISFKEILDKENEIDMLKMDIEGAENNIFMEDNLALYKIKNLFLEYHSYKGQKQYLHKILNRLAENNFRYYVLDSVSKPKSNIGDLDLQCNIIAIRADK
jgi:FkbM family methyltransferase